MDPEGHRLDLLDQALHGGDSPNVRWPMSRIRETFTAQDARNWWSCENRRHDGCGDGFCSAYRPWYYEIGRPDFTQWCLDLSHWLVHECGMPLNAFLRPCDAQVGAYALDCLFKAYLTFSVTGVLFEFFSARGAKPYQSYSLRLALFSFRSIELRYAPFQEFGAIVKKLLDCGARLEPQQLTQLAEGPMKRHAERATVCTITDWYDNRMCTRAACIALLGCMKRRPDLRRYLAPDVWRLMAKIVWEHRFSNQISLNC